MPSLHGITYVSVMQEKYNFYVNLVNHCMALLFFFGLQENILDTYVCYIIFFKFSVLQGPKGSSGKNTK